MAKAREYKERRRTEQDVSFVMSPPTLTLHEGTAYEIRTCEELVDGRWEGFISMRPARPVTKRVQ